MVEFYLRCRLPTLYVGRRLPTATESVYPARSLGRIGVSDVPDYIPDNIATNALKLGVAFICDGICMPKWNTTIYTLSFLILGWLSFYFT